MTGNPPLLGRDPGRGDVVAMRALAQRLHHHAAGLPSVATATQLARSLIDRQQTVSCRRLSELLAAPLQLAERLVAACAQAATVLQGYQQGVDDLDRRARSCRQAVAQAVSERAIVQLHLASSLDAAQAAARQQEHAALDTEITRQVQRWSELQAEREALDARTRRALESIPLLDAPWPSSTSGTRAVAMALYGWQHDVSALRSAFAALAADPAQVSALWQQLPSEVRADVLETHPEIVRNLDGIPMIDRILANRRYVQQHRDELAQQIDVTYLDAIIRGETQVCLFDPAGDRIIEVIGDLSAEVRRVVTYVPGTGADLDGFVSGWHQQASEYLADEHTNPGTVAFVYKDGPWINWTTRSNLDATYLALYGVGIARFQQVVQLEPKLADALQVGVGHSAGVTAQLYAERAGAHYDLQVALGGAYAPAQWQPAADTRYSSHNYAGDAILVLDVHNEVGDLLVPDALDSLRPALPTVATAEVFEHHFYPRVAGDSAIDAHNRITEGPETNQQPLDAVVRAIKEVESARRAK